MTEKLIRLRRIIEKRKVSMAKFNSARENFEKKEKKMKADLEEASKIWINLSERFRWWSAKGGLP
jgi:hypothetical protein